MYFIIFLLTVFLVIVCVGYKRVIDEETAALKAEFGEDALDD